MKTGIEQLDKDLEVLLSLNTPQKIEEIQRLNKREDRTIGDILAVVKTDAIRVASALMSEEIYEDLRSKVKTESINDLNKARAFAREYLEEIVNDEIVRSELFQPKSEKTFSPIGESLNVISSIGGVSNWLIQEKKVTPAIRFAFSNLNREQLLLQTTLDWDDTLLVAEALLEILNDDIELLPTLLNKDIRKNKLNIDSKELLSRLERITQQLDSIKTNLSNINV